MPVIIPSYSAACIGPLNALSPGAKVARYVWKSPCSDLMVSTMMVSVFSVGTAGCAMTEPARNTDTSLISLLAGFKVELQCGELRASAVEIECNMTDSEVADAFAGIQKLSIESMKSIVDSLS